MYVQLSVRFKISLDMVRLPQHRQSDINIRAIFAEADRIPGKARKGAGVAAYVGAHFNTDDAVTGGLCGHIPQPAPKPCLRSKVSSSNVLLGRSCSSVSTLTSPASPQLGQR